MSQSEAHLALCAQLDGDGDFPPIVWPNRPASDAIPRIEVVFINNRPERIGIGSNTQHRYPGIFQATVIVEPKDGPYAGMALAERVAALFPADWRTAITGGYVRVKEAPYIDGGFADKFGWRIPVSVFFDAFF